MVARNAITQDGIAMTTITKLDAMSVVYMMKVGLDMRLVFAVKLGVE